jgi:hypothetical protein
VKALKKQTEMTFVVKTASLNGLRMNPNWVFCDPGLDIFRFEFFTAIFAVTYFLSFSSFDGLGGGG